MIIDEDTKRHWRVIEELETQTDRGIAIVGATYLDERLEQAIKETFTDKIHKKIKINNNKEKPNKRLFSGYGPLSSFSSKIDIAFAMGFFGEESFKDLHRIRDIRNKFAHSVEPISFKTPEISAICNDLWYSKNVLAYGKTKPSTEEKELFLDTLFIIYNLIWTEMIKKNLVGDNKIEKPKPYCME